jgi:VanZ family protein
MGVIFSFSSRGQVTASTVAWQDFGIKKMAHVTEYFILSLLVYRSLRKSTKMSSKSAFFWTIVFCCVYATSDEIHQSFTPERTPAVRDVLIDTFGASIGAFLSSLRT